MSAGDPQQRDTLFYDGQCPLCRHEMQRLANYSGEALRLQDIHQLDDDNELPPKAQLLSQLHLQTAAGDWLTGLDANIAAWQHSPYRRLWRSLDWPWLRPVAAGLYRLWLHAYRFGQRRRQLSQQTSVL